MGPCAYHAYRKRYEYKSQFRDSSGRVQQRVTYSPEATVKGVDGVEVEPYELHLVHWVDDILIPYTDGNPDYDTLVTAMRARFELTGGDDANWILNQEIIRDDAKGVMLLSQRAHIRQLCERVYGTPQYTKGDVKTVLPIKYEPSKLDSPQDEAGRRELQPMAVKFRATLGSCLWVACQTRPDVQFAVGALGRKASNPSKADWKALKHLVAYLSSTEDLRLGWGRNVPPGDDQIVLFCDSDFGGDKDTSRSTTGNVAMYHGGVLAHESKRQPLVAMSTMEAELISLCTTGLIAV